MTSRPDLVSSLTTSPSRSDTTTSDTSDDAPPELPALAKIIPTNKRRAWRQPLAWTSTQLRDSGCYFNHVEKSFENVVPEVTESFSRQVRGCMGILMFSDGDIYTQRSEVRGLLSFYGYTARKAICRQILLLYRRKMAAIISIDAFYVKECTEDSPELLAFISFDSIARHRRGYLDWQIGKKGLSNEEVAGLIGEYCAKKETSKEEEDPYVVAIVIALAQASRSMARGKMAMRRSDTSGSGMTNDGPTADTYKVRVLATAAETKAGLYVFTASVSSKFLERLDYPSRGIQCNKLVVSCYRIAGQPIQDLFPKLHYAIQDQAAFESTS